MTEKEKLALVEEVLELDEGTLKPDTKLADIDDYDSMAKLSLIVMFDEEFEKKVTGSVIKEFKTVKDILELMEK